MPRTIVSRMTVPEHVERSILARCRNEAVCDRFTGQDLSMLFGLANGAPGFSEQEAANQGGGVAPMWNLFFNDATAPRTIVATVAQQDIISVAGIPRNVHALLFEIQARLFTDASQALAWTFNVKGPGTIAYGNASLTITTVADPIITSALYRAIVHLAGHWKTTTSPFVGYTMGHLTHIREDTGGASSTIPSLANVAGETPIIGDLSVIPELVLSGVYGNWRVQFGVGAITNNPVLQIMRARIYTH